MTTSTVHDGPGTDTAVRINAVADGLTDGITRKRLRVAGRLPTTISGTGLRDPAKSSNRRSLRQAGRAPQDPVVPEAVPAEKESAKRQRQSPDAAEVDRRSAVAGPPVDNQKKVRWVLDILLEKTNTIGVSGRGDFGLSTFVLLNAAVATIPLSFFWQTGSDGYPFGGVLAPIEYALRHKKQKNKNLIRETSCSDFYDYRDIFVCFGSGRLSS